MHTSLRVTGVLSGLESSVVLGLGFRGWDAAQAVHSLRSLYQLTHAEVMFSRSARVRIGPVRNGERWRTHSVSLETDGGLAQCVVQGVADGTDRSDQPFQHQRLAVMYCSVLASGVAMMDRVVEWIALTGAEACGVSQRALHEAGVFGHRALGSHR